MKHSRAMRAMAGALAVLALTTSCYGPFNATRRLHEWNGDVSENKWAVEGMFLLVVIIPVYGVFMLGDAIIFNSIEFWGGENPIDPPTAMLDDEGRTLRVENVAAADGAAIRASIVNAGVVEEDLCTDTDLSGVTTLTNSAGAILATVEPLADGDVMVRDALGREIARGPATALR